MVYAQFRHIILLNILICGFPEAEELRNTDAHLFIYLSIPICVSVSIQPYIHTYTHK